MTIHQLVQKAWKRCEFPGKDRYTIEVDLHAHGWGEHRLILSWMVPNTDSRPSEHKWRDDFGNKYSVTNYPGEVISVLHQAPFSYQESYPWGFFERLIAQIHVELQVHEALETFMVGGDRRWYPHEKAEIISPRTGTLHVHESWRNILAWDGVKAAMDNVPPELPAWAKWYMWKRKVRKDLKVADKIWKNCKANVGSFEGWGRPRYVVSCLNQVWQAVYGKESVWLWRLEGWFKDLRNSQLARRMEKNMKETQKEAA